MIFNQNEKNLINLKLIKEKNGKKHSTRALILLTDNKFFDYARIKCARFKGTDTSEFMDQKEFNSPLYEQVENCMTFAKSYISKSGKITELQRIDEYEIPLVVIREAV